MITDDDFELLNSGFDYDTQLRNAALLMDAESFSNEEEKRAVVALHIISHLYARLYATDLIGDYLNAEAGSPYQKTLVQTAALTCQNVLMAQLQEKVRLGETLLRGKRSDCHPRFDAAATQTLSVYAGCFEIGKKEAQRKIDIVRRAANVFDFELPSEPLPSLSPIFDALRGVREYRLWAGRCPTWLALGADVPVIDNVEAHP